MGKDSICIGVDQSYKRTGISVFCNGNMVSISSIDLSHCLSNAEKRKVVKSAILDIISSIDLSKHAVSCVIERIRTFSKGCISTDYIKSMGALNCTISDACAMYGIRTYSVDTRCWKATVVGSSKPHSNNYGVAEEKWLTVKWCMDNGWKKHILKESLNPRKVKGTFTSKKNGKKYYFDDDACDSAGIAKFWFIGDHNKLKLEQ